MLRLQAGRDPGAGQAPGRQVPEEQLPSVTADARRTAGQTQGGGREGAASNKLAGGTARALHALQREGDCSGGKVCRK